ncbi:MAG: hypothetical protein L0287_36595, partial [Anaerolineae bacterium]|nr:hypothetical protein [Anaerolineae bacterium]
MRSQFENLNSSQPISETDDVSKLDVVIWAHSDQDGGTELACVLAKTFMEEFKSLQIAVVTPKPDNVKNFFTYEIVNANDLCIITSPSLLRMEKRSGSVDAKATREMLLKNPFKQGENGTFPQLMALVDDLKNNLIVPRIHNRTLMISTGEPIAVEIASQLGIKCVIVSDHLLTSSIRWLLRNGGLFDKGMAHLFTLFEDFDRKADKAFLSPLEFAGGDYETYLGHGGIDCNFIGGLFYEPISEAKL